MRTAVIADIHANLEALGAVLARIEMLKVDETVCLGDVVGYNANPNECVDLIRSMEIECIMGNHDSCASGLEEPDSFNALARRAVLWTRERLTGENRQFLMTLPRQLLVHDFVIFHGSINETDRYILYKSDAIENFRRMRKLPGGPRIGFFGHTHVRAALSEMDSIVAVEHSPDILLQSERHYLINPGGVGQPRDGDPRASFLVYDRNDNTVTFHRVEYNIRACQDKIIRAGLPAQLAERLALGW